MVACAEADLGHAQAYPLPRGALEGQSRILTRPECYGHRRATYGKGAGKWLGQGQC
jgi:hypothetical protein